MEPTIMISELQHFSFCRRQWALIHLEAKWAESFRTADGRAMHKNAHNGKLTEKRKNLLIARGLPISSQALGLSGICDVVEFKKTTDASHGISLFGYEGLWLPYPVEYKRGSAKSGNEDKIQLCAQAICLEEMLAANITFGSLFYGETKRRQEVEFSSELRKEVLSMINEIRSYYSKGYTPRVKWSKACSACSLKEICVPKTGRNRSVREYIKKTAGELE